MNYRHAYHAGNFADVHKHATLTLLLAHLRGKDSAFHVFDGHAGVGLYDLQSPEPGKTGEFRDGIARLMGVAPPEPTLADYLATVAAVNLEGALRFYPGSPWLIRHALRPDDRLTCVELHPDDAARLRARFGGDRQVNVRHDDTYRALKALLPPRRRRGLVLLDPPFEAADEAQRLISGLTEALRRWPTGIYAVWYPIKAVAAAARFTAELAQCGRPCLTSELMRGSGEDETRLNGSGLALVNPPWQLDRQLTSLLKLLHERLGCRGKTIVRWLAHE
jgi:23S rRNA (adenine2030-N6)-methyltransferase